MHNRIKMRRLKKAEEGLRRPRGQRSLRGRRKSSHTSQALSSPLKPSQASDLLVEIGTEELPAAYLGPAIQQVRQEAQRLFRESHLEVKRVDAFGTPRRLILLAHALQRTQHTPPEEIRGPSKQAAFDATGSPTPALKGFLNAKGGVLAQTKVVSTEKGDYVYLLKPGRSLPTATVLPEVIRQLVNRLRFPKTMRWDNSGVRFARPIRWLLVLYGTTLVRVSVGRVVSGRLTWVGGPKRPKAMRVQRPANYVALMPRWGIVCDPQKRQQRIERLVKTSAKPYRARPVPEMMTYGLLEEVTALVECPVAVVGQFDPKYLMLPREVLLASMAKYQRVFALEQASGRLIPAFVAILDGAPHKPQRVRQVYEHILNARLADSLLFWQQDHKQLPLDQLAQQLREVAFHQRLGSMAEKSARLEQLSQALAEAWQLSQEDLTQLRRACQLAKADLVSTMVKEFPTLQGVVGKSYALDSHERAAVADAIEEQYLPLGNRLPKTLIGSALAILDKYDTLSSYFAIGIEPTGDEDPFGLRRAAQGIVEVAWAIHRPLPLDRLWQVRSTLTPFSEGRPDSTAHTTKVRQRLHTYLAERLYTFSWPKPAPLRDVIDAVLTSPWEDLVDVMDRISSLQRLDGKRTLLKAAKVVERTHNILKAATIRQGEVDPARFQEPLERRLWELYQHHRDRVLQLIHRKSYAEATTVYGEVFFDPLHEFFERVMVNVNEEALQQNRLVLMRTINTLYTERVADLSKLAILQTATHE